MAIKDIIQPELIQINETLRLRKYDGKFDIAYSWYQEEETVRLVDGFNAKAYDWDKLERMYTYLDNQGELYFIEVLEVESYHPIGDVTFWKEDMPIVIGDGRYRGRKIGSLVINALIDRAKEIGYEALYIGEIYDYNIGSQALFEKAGFKKHQKTEQGYRYQLVLKER
jgi:RimJ/RimL family protein N-acetyltransferase